MRLLYAALAFTLLGLTSHTDAQQRPAPKISPVADLQWLYEHVRDIDKSSHSLFDVERRATFYVGYSKMCSGEVNVAIRPMGTKPHHGMVILDAVTCGFEVTLRGHTYVIRGRSFFGLNTEDGSLILGGIPWVEERPDQGMHYLPKGEHSMAVVSDLIRRIVAREKERLANASPARR